MIRGLSLTQPWASLVALGAKEWETRSWPTSYRGQVAIHASKSYPRWAKETAAEPLFHRALHHATGAYAYPELYCGRVVALASLVACRRTEEFFSVGSAGEASRHGVIIPSEEFAFGDFHEGRYAFRLANVLRLREPIPCRGALGLWAVPDEVVARIYQQLREMKEECVS